MGSKSLYFLIHKPFGVLSQFTDEDGHPGLGSIFSLPKDVYPVGRLDRDSEGLLILTNDRKLNQALLNPKNKHKRTYWSEVDGVPGQQQMEALRAGVRISIKGKKHQTMPAEANKLPDLKIEERIPPVNRIKHKNTSWIELKLIEGKNRQVRKMTASVGHPTLRLIRVGIEDIHIGNMQPGEITQISENILKKKLHL